MEAATAQVRADDNDSYDLGRKIHYIDWQGEYLRDISNTLRSIQLDLRNAATRDDIRELRDKQEKLATKVELADVKRELNTKIDGVKDELKTEIGGVKDELKSDIRELRDKQDTFATKEDLSAVKDELKTDIANLTEDMHNMFRHTQIMFITAVGVIVAVLAYFSTLLTK